MRFLVGDCKAAYGSQSIGNGDIICRRGRVWDRLDEGSALFYFGRKAEVAYRGEGQIISYSGY
jgi:hypothetical protein